MEPFGARFVSAVERRGRLCVGIDPHANLLRAWGLDDDVDGLRRFTDVCVEAFADRVAVVKPQSAFFERHGARGIAVLEDTVAAFRSAGTLVLLDAKRGDVGSTMGGYAEAYLDPSSSLAVDAMTVNPFLGFESLRPVLDAAGSSGAGVFVLALTSNPEAAQVQRARTSEGSVAGDLLAAVRAENEGVEPLGSVGAVVGATVGELDADVDLDVNGPLLAPGYGAQGGTAADLRRLFGSAWHAVLPSTSRGVLSAGPSVQGLRDAASRSLDELG